MKTDVEKQSRRFHGRRAAAGSAVVAASTGAFLRAHLAGLGQQEAPASSACSTFFQLLQILGRCLSALNLLLQVTWVEF